MRLAIIISFALAGWCGPALADEALIKCAIGTHVGYIVPEHYAEAHRVELVDTLPDGAKVDSFWTPSEAAAVVADRIFHELLQSAVKDPTVLFPDLSATGDASSPDSLAYQHNELQLILDNYGQYLRQYVGIVVEGKPYLLCNYAVGPDLNAAGGYLFIQKVFVPNGKVHFLQCRIDYDWKICSHVSMIGPWQEKDK